MSPSSSDDLARRLCWFTSIIYGLHAVVAVTLHRHLFGDAAWFLVHLASTGAPFALVQSPQAFFQSRAVAFWLTQGPAVGALHLGLRDLHALSWIYGATLFAHKLASLVLCHRLLPAGRKLYFVFPALGLFAGSINSDGYVVSEAHVAVSMAWPLLLTLANPSWGGARWAVATGAAVVAAAFTYESFGLFAALLLGVVACRWWSAGRPRSLGLATLAALLLAAALVNLAAILHPRDPTQAGAFLSGLRELLRSARGNIAWIHCGPTASALAVLAAAALFLVPSRRHWPWRPPLVAGCCLALALGPPLHGLAFPDSVVLETAMGDRSFSGLAMQLPLMAGFLWAWTRGRDRFQRGGPALAALLLALAIGQVGWQLLATRSWDLAVADTRARVSTEIGALSCPTHVGDPASTPSRLHADHVLCRWWVTPLSIALAPAGRIGALVVSDDPFQAFDARRLDALPSLAHVTHDYGPYAAALGAAPR